VFRDTPSEAWNGFEGCAVVEFIISTWKSVCRTVDNGEDVLFTAEIRRLVRMLACLRIVAALDTWGN
jgi:hypothetical protein